MALDLLAALAAARWLGRDFYELYNLAYGCGHLGLAVGEEVALP